MNQLPMTNQQHSPAPAAATGKAWNEQYLRDLETLGRIEFQNACFFDAMGAIQAGEGSQ